MVVAGGFMMGSLRASGCGGLDWSSRQAGTNAGRESTKGQRRSCWCQVRQLFTKRTDVCDLPPRARPIADKMAASKPGRMSRKKALDPVRELKPCPAVGKRRRWLTLARGY